MRLVSSSTRRAPDFGSGRDAQLAIRGIESRFSVQRDWDRGSVISTGFLFEGPSPSMAREECVFKLAGYKGTLNE